jgi:hypothetical protein
MKSEPATAKEGAYVAAVGAKSVVGEVEVG